MEQFQLPLFPTMFFEQYFCQTCHSLFSGGHDLQNINLPVEVSSPGGNFDTPWKFCGKPDEIQSQNFDFDTQQTLILYGGSIFLRGFSYKKTVIKNLFFIKTLSKLGALQSPYF
jgi:hypothetical protein